VRAAGAAQGRRRRIGFIRAEGPYMQTDPNQITTLSLLLALKVNTGEAGRCLRLKWSVVPERCHSSATHVFASAVIAVERNSTGFGTTGAAFLNVAYISQHLRSSWVSWSRIQFIALYRLDPASKFGPAVVAMAAGNQLQSTKRSSSVAWSPRNLSV